MNIAKKIALAAALTAVLAGGASACDLNHGGFIAQIVKCAAPDLAPIVDPIDKWNGANGHPV